MIPHIRAVSFFTSMCSFIFNDGYTVLFHFAVNLTWYFWVSIFDNLVSKWFEHIWDCVKIRVWIGPRWSRRMDRSGSPAFWYGSGGMDRPVGSGYGSGLYILTRSHLFWAIVNGTLERNLLINIQHNEERNFLISQKLTKYCLFMYGIFDLLCQQKPWGKKTNRKVKSSKNNRRRKEEETKRKQTGNEEERQTNKLHLWN